MLNPEHNHTLIIEGAVYMCQKDGSNEIGPKSIIHNSVFISLLAFMITLIAGRRQREMAEVILQVIFI